MKKSKQKKAKKIRNKRYTNVLIERIMITEFFLIECYFFVIETGFLLHMKFFCQSTFNKWKYNIYDNTFFTVLLNKNII